MPENQQTNVAIACSACGKLIQEPTLLVPDDVVFTRCNECEAAKVPIIFDDRLMNLWSNLSRVFGIPAKEEQESIISAILLLGACVLRSAQLVREKSDE